MNQVSAVLSKTLRLVAQAFLALLGLATIGSLIPSIPFFGELGPVLTSALGPWLIVLGLVGAVVMFRHWWKSRSKIKLCVASLAAFAAIGASYVIAQQVGVARANGVQLDFFQVLTAGSQIDASLKPVTINYSNHDGQNLPLEIYHPKMPVTVGQVPIFVYIHGGGWGAQTLRQRQADFRWFAERGYLVMSLEYPLSSETRHTWNVAEPQLGCALAWIGANAARYGGDASRLVLWGESAGGNLALNVSYRANQGLLKTACAGAVPAVAATIALYPVVDPALMYRNPNPLVGVFGRTMTVRYTGGTPEQFPDRYTAIASATHISAKGPPTMLIIPQSDHLVDPRAADTFEAKARAAGVATRIIRVPYAEHSFDLRSGGIGNQLVRQTTLQFLASNGLKP